MESIDSHLGLHADPNQLSIQSNDESGRDDFEDPVNEVDHNGSDDHPVAVRSVCQKDGVVGEELVDVGVEERKTGDL